MNIYGYKNNEKKEVRNEIFRNFNYLQLQFAVSPIYREGI
jgi:hypothetical protein